MAYPGFQMIAERAGLRSSAIYLTH